VRASAKLRQQRGGVERYGAVVGLGLHAVCGAGGGDFRVGRLEAGEAEAQMELEVFDGVPSQVRPGQGGAWLAGGKGERGERLGRRVV
jgi:hypothetical protein